ncbi:MAG: response regulator [Chthonomonadales bacterium]|nr:response regulator [Chthonomonadales bacterium]
MSDCQADVLVVEDDPNDLELTLRALKRHHLANEVQVARDGAEAVRLLFGEDENTPVSPPPKVILLDLKLPRMSGLEVLRKIKGDPRTRRIPVVMLTSSQEDRDIAECYEAGANSYIVKPVEFERFVEAMRVVGLFWMVVASNPGASMPQETPAA